MTAHLNIDSLLGKAKKRIYRVGIELEGGWWKLPEGVHLVRDGSVIIPDDLVYQHPAPPVPQPGRKNLHVGELQSEPLEPGKFSSWVKQFYPHKVNGTCGLHVHMSFKSALHYQILMVPEYQATMVTYIQKWAENENLPKGHPIWDRLRGKSEHCQHKFFADMQAKASRKDYHRENPGNRYTVINYCYSLHNTLECRLLPMMDTHDQGVRAVQRVLDVTNACLSVLAKREEKLKFQVTVSSGDEIELDKKELYV